MYRYSLFIGRECRGKVQFKSLGGYLCAEKYLTRCDLCPSCGGKARALLRGCV